MIAFTLCSNNYLAQAKTLGDSLTRHNPGYKFVIGLVDEKAAAVDYDFFLPYEVIPVREIGIPDFDDLWRKYNIVELNTSVKASFFKYLKLNHPEATFIFYFDPDIMIFQPLRQLENEFLHDDIILTPHILQPVPLDDNLPEEAVFLNFGLYNLGFLGVRNQSDIVSSFLDWWEERTLKFGFNDQPHGLFVDQLWINLVPLFFEKVRILRTMGYNTAPWNLRERHLFQQDNGDYTLNDQSTLHFFHFSAYNYQVPEEMSRHYNLDLLNLPAIKTLYKIYLDRILENRIDTLSKLPCHYVEARQKYLDEINRPEPEEVVVENKTKRLLKEFVPPRVCPVVQEPGQKKWPA